MGPDENALEQVKKDAIIGTLRHFERDAEDHGTDFAQDLSVVKRTLLAENEGTLIEGEVVENKDAEPKLADMKRPDLEALATELGIAEPDKAPNKAELVKAIKEKKALNATEA